MNRLTKIILLTLPWSLTNAHAVDKRVQDRVLDDHTVYEVPVSGAGVTTISFPSAIAAIDAALTTSDGKTPGVFQIAHTKGTAYLSVRALAKDATTNLNVRWNNRTYVFELRESAEPWYSVVLQPQPGKSNHTKLEVHIGDRTVNPSVSDLTSNIAADETVSGYIATSGGLEGPNDVSLKNEFTFALARRDPTIETPTSPTPLATSAKPEATPAESTMPESAPIEPTPIPQ